MIAISSVSNLEMLGILSRNGAKIYVELLSAAYMTPKELSNVLEIHLQTVYQELKDLEQKQLIASRGTSPKEYFVDNPQRGLKTLVADLKANMNRLHQLADKVLDESISAYQKKFQEGRCLRRFAFFLYTDYDMGMRFLKNQINDAQTEILVYNFPKELLSKLANDLKSALERGVWVGVYLDRTDIEVANQLQPCHVFKGDLSSSTRPGNYIVNDEDYHQGDICVDKERLISLWYKRPFVLEEAVINSFYSPQIITGIKNMYLAVLDRDPLATESTDESVRPTDFIKNAVQSGHVTKREILELAQRENFVLTGRMIKEAIAKMKSENEITVNIIKKGRGRPREEITLRNDQT